MKKISLLFCMVLLICGQAIAQEEKSSFFKEHPFVNMTEFGGLFGRVKMPVGYYYSYSSYWPGPQGYTYKMKNAANISVQTFNGIYLNRKTAAGITVGADWYDAALIVPVSAGIRRVLVEKKNGGSSLVAGLDAGYGTTLLQEDDENRKTNGGLMVNPAIGFKFPMRNGSAWLLNFGYKYQRITVDDLINEKDIYNLSGSESRNHNRVQIRLGFQF